MSFVLSMAQREELEPVHLDVVPVDRVFVVAAPNGGFAAGLFLASDRRSKSLRLFGRSKFSFLKDPFALTYDRPSIFLRKVKLDSVVSFDAQSPTLFEHVADTHQISVPCARKRVDEPAVSRFPVILKAVEVAEGQTSMIRGVVGPVCRAPPIEFGVCLGQGLS